MVISLSFLYFGLSFPSCGSEGARPLLHWLSTSLWTFAPSEVSTGPTVTWLSRPRWTPPRITPELELNCDAGQKAFGFHARYRPAPPRPFGKLYSAATAHGSAGRSTPSA